jgi:LPS-assembly protein
MSYLRSIASGLIGLVLLGLPLARAAAPSTAVTHKGSGEVEQIHITADHLTATRDGKVVLEGHVTLVRGGQTISADRVVYDRKKNTVDAQGSVKLVTKEGDHFQSTSTFLRLNDNTGNAGAGQYFLHVSHGRGHAKKVLFEGKEKLILKGVRFTTCPADREDWHLFVSTLKMNRKRDTGTAHNAVLLLKGVPLMYTPYLSFPLSDRRQSGFLIPDMGSTDTIGTYFALPYYLNLAPNYDATLRPRYMSLRGLQLQTEFRYLGKSLEGTAEIEALPGDRVTGTDRYAASLHHKQRLSDHLTANADINWVSDQDYFDDFSSNLSLTSRSHLPQNLTFQYQNRDWTLAALFSRYQTLDKTLLTTEYPYERLPQLSVELRPPERANQLNYTLRGSATMFRHEDPAMPTGERLTANPGISLPLRRDFGYFVPRLSLYHSSYYQQSNGANGGFTTGVASIDSGLYFDRSVGRATSHWKQTLEPRLFYVYSPYVNQDSLPVYDSNIPEFTFDSLFRENRFVGGDRVGDTNRLTAAVTTRLVDENTGIERITASMGQVFYLADRRVSIPPGAPATTSQSDLVGELSAFIGRHWYWRGSLFWDPANAITDAHTEYLQYHPTKDRILNFGYRFRRGVQDLVDISTQWTLGSRWTVLARSQYSLLDQRNFDTTLGLEYRQCCWALRTVANRRINQNSQQVNSVAVQISFSGLGGPDSGSLRNTPLNQTILP